MHKTQKITKVYSETVEIKLWERTKDNSDTFEDTQNQACQPQDKGHYFPKCQVQQEISVKFTLNLFWERSSIYLPKINKNCIELS